MSCNILQASELFDLFSVNTQVPSHNMHISVSAFFFFGAECEMWGERFHNMSYCTIAVQ